MSGFTSRQAAANAGREYKKRAADAAYRAPEFHSAAGLKLNPQKDEVVWSPQSGPQKAYVDCPVAEVLFGGSRGGGKRLWTETLVPVTLDTDPSGYKTMGTVSVGDRVFSPRGEPVEVEWVSPIMEAPESYEVLFNTGDVILADAEHLWHTMTAKERKYAAKANEEWRAKRRASRPSRAKTVSQKPGVSADVTKRNRERLHEYKEASTGGIRTTAEIAASLMDGKEVNHSIALTSPIELPDVELPIDPYVLGAWLGDGYQRGGYIGMGQPDWEVLAHKFPPPAWMSVDDQPPRKTPFVDVRFEGMTTKLRHLGLADVKRIPPQYLRASLEQRRELLRGILDTDGYCDQRGQIEIGFSNLDLIEDTLDLLSSLGIKGVIRSKQATINGRDVGTTWRIKFLAPFPAFHLPRKLERQKFDEMRPTVNRRFIVSVSKIAPVPMRCIKVAHDDGLYLVGKTMIATHNTDGILGKWAIKASRYGSGVNAVFFRQEMPQTDDLIERAKEIYAPLGASWREQQKTFVFKSGARIRFRPLESTQDAAKYQGQNLSDAAVEEAGNYAASAPIDMLFGALRSVKGVPTQLTMTANPGGAGHQWIKRRFIDPAPQGMKVMERKLPSGGSHRYVYIPSRVQDNKALLARDPDYVNRLYLVGSEALVKAWLTGDWNVVAGAFFDCFDTDRHVIEPFEIPPHWVRFMGFDWGSARPFCAQWWAVSDGNPVYVPHREAPNARTRQFPQGAMILYREWYGAKEGSSNEGLRMATADIARGIREREYGEKIDFRIADPACWKVDGGPSHAEIMGRNGVSLRPADNSRIAGWTMVRDRLLGDDGGPMLYAFNTAVDFIRTVPVLQHDDIRPEDVDCWVAGTMIDTPHGPKKIEDVLAGDVVNTPIGPRPVLRSYLSGTSKTVRVSLSDGSFLEGTPHHKIAIVGHGLVALKDLECYMIPYRRTIWPNALNTVVSCIRAMRGAYITIRTGLSFLTAARVFTGKFGWMRAEKFQPDGTSITSTTTTTTTSSKISHVLPRENTADFTCENVWRVSLDNGSRSGVVRQTDKKHYEKTLGKWSKIRLFTNARADIVAVLLQQSALKSTIAQILVRTKIGPLFQTARAKFARLRFIQNHTQQKESKHAHIIAVGSLEEKKEVYNLTVGEAYLFYANGVLSSNTKSEDHSADAARYCVMARPWYRKPSVETPMRGIGQMTLDEAWRLARPRGPFEGRI